MGRWKRIGMGVVLILDLTVAPALVLVQVPFRMIVFAMVLMDWSGRVRMGGMVALVVLVVFPSAEEPTRRAEHSSG